MVYTRENYIPSQIFCPNCQAKNPLKTENCEKCHQPIHGQIKNDFLKRQFKLNRVVFFIVGALASVGILGVRRMIKIAENHVQNIQNQTDQYNQSTIKFRKTQVSFQKDQEAKSFENFDF